LIFSFHNLHFGFYGDYCHLHGLIFSLYLNEQSEMKNLQNDLKSRPFAL